MGQDESTYAHTWVYNLAYIIPASFRLRTFSWASGLRKFQFIVLQILDKLTLKKQLLNIIIHLVVTAGIFYSYLSWNLDKKYYSLIIFFLFFFLDKNYYYYANYIYTISKVFRYQNYIISFFKFIFSMKRTYNYLCFIWIHLYDYRLTSTFTDKSIYG